MFFANRFFCLKASYGSFRLGIRREGKSRWERRTPLVPSDLAKLLSKHSDLSVVVQPCTKRCYPNDMYKQAGATIEENLGGCDMILGIKEVPIEEIIPKTSYLYFSHTHKGQLHNVPVLRDMLRKKTRLFDLELLTDDSGKRLVQFGYFAGFAGAVNSLHGLGDLLLALGYANPFLNIPMAQWIDSTSSTKLLLKNIIANKIQYEGIPHLFSPLVYCVSGTGHVAKGALDVLTLLPHEYVSAEDLEELVMKRSNSGKFCYCCHSNRSQILQSAKRFSYVKLHQKIMSHINKILPWISVFVNGIYWDDRYPRFITQEMLDGLGNSGKLRLLSIADITCDIKGSIQVVTKATTIDSPFFEVPAGRNRKIQIMSIDNLPCQFPRDSSGYFSGLLKNLISEYISFDPTLPKVFEKAQVTTKEGVLAGKFSHLSSLIKKSNETNSFNLKKIPKYKILLLGNGLVSMPVVDYFEKISKKNRVHMTVIGMNPTLANGSQSSGHTFEKNENFSLTYLQSDLMNLGELNRLKDLATTHDIIISLLPANLHWKVAEIAIERRKSMVTTSYLCDKMIALNEKAKESNVLILGEMGLDPGLDHLSAAKIINEIGPSKISSFQSWCGGLPAPECTGIGNPLRYKFSWSPKGSLLAPMNACRFMLQGKVIEFEKGGSLLDHPFTFSDDFTPNAKNFTLHPSLLPGFNLEGLANRDSLAYLGLYNLEKAPLLKTFIRGTLRYAGFSKLLTEIRDLGLLSSSQTKIFSECRNWAEAMKLFSIKMTSLSPEALQGLQWLGIFSQFEPFLGEKYTSWIDALSELMARNISFGPEERDLVLLEHKIEAVTSSIEIPLERTTSTLVVYGEACINQIRNISDDTSIEPWKVPQSAMSKTVGYPAAIAAKAILDGQVKLRNGNQAIGIVNPLDLNKSFADSLLDELAAFDIVFKEHKEKVFRSPVKI